MIKKMLIALAAILILPKAAPAQYPRWKHSGSVYLLTTPEGANLPNSASEDGFPLLVRLHKDFFNFSQAKANGEDIRFSTSTGTPLAYQIEEWDAENGTASIWVRIPTIKGNARQQIKLYWGKTDAAGESSGRAVFNGSNGYLSVWHMNGPVNDEVGTLESKDVGTTATEGVIGQARHFAEKQGIFCGDKITHYPSDASPHSSEAWFRAEKPNAQVLAWGNEQAQGKVVMQFRSPPHMTMDCYFSDANVKGGSTLAMCQWIHVVHTYQKGDSRIYVNGVLDGVSTTPAAPLSIKSPAKLWIGGWYHNYDFIGDIDEARISSVARSADWVRLQYENQKPLQTLVGPLVQKGNAFSVSRTRLTVPEGKSATITARAGGAQKVYWLFKKDGVETIAAVDRFNFTIDAGRVTGDQSLVLQFKAIYANEVKTKDIALTIKEDIPEPVFTLKAPTKWDGRETIEVIPQIANLKEMQAKGVDNQNYTWTVSNIAVIKEIAPGKLILKRAQNSGNMAVMLAVSNGGAEVTGATTIRVQEPAKDAWVERTPAKDEKPDDNQFYARDDKNEGTLYYNGTLDRPADSVFLKVYANDKIFKTESQKLAADKTYAFTVKLEPGLIKYKVEFGTKTGSAETVVRTVTNLVCGDAYIIQGQSNAEATGPNNGPTVDPSTSLSDWIRSYGNSYDGTPRGGWGNAIRTRIWGTPDYGFCQIGSWGMVLASNLVAKYGIPICIMNGALGGTRIDQHQRNEADHEDPTTIYGRLLTRIEAAKLTHGIRGVLWHQGENNQGSDSPTGDYDWKSYQQYFVDLSAAWKQDYPNIQHYYIFQIWPKACSMGTNGSDNMLREVQRTLPSYFSNMGIMSTLGIKPPGDCHYPIEGYAEMARLICPLVERDHYGRIFPDAITPPNLKAARYTSDKHDHIAMEFDQDMAWTDALVSEFYLDGEADYVVSGSVSGNVITLKLRDASMAQKLTYLDSSSWSVDNLLYGENGIAALTFCNVSISENKPR
jgi:hypothetical protein